ncbi:MAG: hexokinase [Dysgonamonadaceae bacterium]|jgi:hexokinase|nr:hexokinase [Dysgonamonadaceae bacterium]
MKSNIFELTKGQLEEIAKDLQRKIAVGLQTDDTEIACLPTYVNPGKDFEGKVLALDWGGTNFRAAIVEFKKGAKPVTLENLKKPLSCVETKGFSREDLFNAMASHIAQLKHLDKSVTHIGYCFSYPAASTTKVEANAETKTEAEVEGGAILLRWTKEIWIPEMLKKPVGKPLMEYLNQYEGIKEKTQFKSIKVVNDTIACLFAGLAQPGYDTYIGLIVGTGTNMAALIHKDQIPKLDRHYHSGDLIPVNLESGNLVPTPDPNHAGEYLTVVDQRVDENSDQPKKQLFEKAISGGYLGKIFENAFPGAIESKFDGEKLTNLMNYPMIYKEEYTAVARAIYVRSAQLVAASLAGLILELIEYREDTQTYDKNIQNICLAADGSLFWSDDRNGSDYNKIVSDSLHGFLASFGLEHIHVYTSKLEDANLIGSAIAALS